MMQSFARALSTDYKMPAKSTLTRWIIDAGDAVQRAISAEVKGKTVSIELDLWRQASEHHCILWCCRAFLEGWCVNEAMSRRHSDACTSYWPCNPGGDENYARAVNIATSCICIHLHV